MFLCVQLLLASLTSLNFLYTFVSLSRVPWEVTTLCEYPTQFYQSFESIPFFSVLLSKARKNRNQSLTPFIRRNRYFAFCNQVPHDAIVTPIDVKDMQSNCPVSLFRHKAERILLHADLSSEFQACSVLLFKKNLS